MQGKPRRLRRGGCHIRARIPEDSSAVITPTELSDKLESLSQESIAAEEPNQETPYIAANARSTVTTDRISTIEGMLREGEKVVHILRVPIMRHGPEGEEKSMSTKHTKTGTAAFTEDRVVIMIPHQLADDQFVIRYEDVENIAYNMEGKITASRGFEITTTGEKYRLGVHYKIEDEEVREVLNWLDEQTASDRTDQSNKDKSLSTRERLQELEVMKDEGLISQQEFNQKREEILENH